VIARVKKSFGGTIRFLVAAISCLFCSVSIAQAELPVFFAGTAIIGASQGQAERYPHVSELLELEDERGASLVDTLLVERLRATETGHNFQFGELADYRDGDGVVLALAIDWENVSTTDIDGNTKYVVDVHGQVLAFDYSTMKVVGAFPIGVQVRDARKGGPSDDHARALARRALIGEDDFGLLASFVEMLKQVELKPAYSNRIQVTTAELSPESVSVVDELGLDADAFSARVGQTMSKYLASNQSVPVLPFKKGTVIGNQMAAQFTNGDVYQLEIPNPDYTVSFTVDRLRKLELDRTSSQIAYLYGLYATARVSQPLLEKDYANHQFKYAVSSTVPVGIRPDDPAAFEELVLSSINSFTQQISDPQREWVDKWGVTDGIQKAFLEMDDVLAKCR